MTRDLVSSSDMTPKHRQHKKIENKAVSNCFNFCAKRTQQENEEKSNNHQTETTHNHQE